MKVRFFERAKGFVRLGCGTMAVLLLATQTQAAQPGWAVQIINIAETIDTNSTATSVLDSNGAGYTIEGGAAGNQTRVYPVVDLAGGGGNYPFNFQYPNGTNNNGNDFAVRATADVVIPAGTWTIAFGSDDGGNLRIDSASAIGFTSTFGENPTDGQSVGLNEILFEAPRGHAWTGGAFTVAAPLTGQVVAQMYERGGGDSFEIAVAQGERTGFGAGTFQLLGNGQFGWQVTTASGAAAGGAAVLEINGNNLGTFNAPGPLVTVINTAGTAQEGLHHRYYLAGNAGTFAAADGLVQGSIPAALFRPEDSAPSQWWSGSDAHITNLTQQRYDPKVLEAINAGLLTLEGNNSLQNYLAVLRGQILIPEDGTYKFKDGVDDYTSLRIDIDGNGSFDNTTEQLINDNAWTDIRGAANGGSPIVEATFTGIAAGGEWLDIEFMAWEGGGGDAGMLAWDYSTTGGVGGNFSFPLLQTDSMDDDALRASAIPDTHLRTFGLTATTSPELASYATYRFDIHSKSFSDKIGAAAGIGVSSNPVNLNGATLEIKNVNDLYNTQSVDLISGPFTGTATFVFPAGTTWDTSNFATTGEITLLTGNPGPGGGGGNPGDFDADGDVDSADLSDFFFAWTGAMAGNAEDGDNPNLVYDPANGSVKLVPGNAARGKIMGFILINSNGQFKPQDDFADRTPWSEPVWDNIPNQLGSADTSFVGTSEVIDLGEIFPAGLDVAGLQGLLTRAQVTWALGPTGRGDLDLVVVPEPGSLALLALGLLGVTSVVRRRRK